MLYVFFVVISKVGGDDKPGEAFYGVQLLGSIVLFGFFGEATGGAVRSVVDRENLVRKIQFPRLGDPALDHAARPVQPRDEPGRRA